MNRKWQFGKWICAKNMPKEYANSAPVFKAELFCSKQPCRAAIFLCSAGWHELYINGVKADDRLLVPSPMQYDKHLPYTEYDAAALLRPGKNQISVLTGNGFFNCGTENTWNFQHAVWRNQFPLSPQVRLLFECETDGKIALASDSSWMFSPSPVTFNEIRNGEYYDARLEDADLPLLPVFPAIPPQGIPMADQVAPCREICRIFPVSRKKSADGMTVYDFGTNLSGWINAEFCGKAGDTVIIRYSERLDENGNIDTAHIAQFIYSGDFQTDRYTLKGAEAGETWHPHFTWHGFRYAALEYPESVTVKQISASFISSDFPASGSFSTSFEPWNELQKVTVRSLRSNFVGFPTDCPHREKNGWTADAHLAAESMLWNFDASSGYENFLQMASDSQQPSGGIASILPTPGWGYGVNPAWDFVIFELPYLLYTFGGSDEIIRSSYPVCEKYLEFCRSCSENDLLDYGLGDWCSPQEVPMPPREYISSAFFYLMNIRMAFFAGVINNADREKYLHYADNIRLALIGKYHNPDGSWSNDGLTANAVALSFGFAIDHKKELAHLIDLCRRSSFKANFGIVGAKYLPRVLAENGFIDEAAEFFIQKDYPGWQHMLCSGATTLWETWRGASSQNHAMFGDFSAWCYRYPAGIRPLENAPGFKKFRIFPLFPEKINGVKAEYKTASGTIVSEWQKDKQKCVLHISVPENTCAELLISGTARILEPGEYSIEQKI